MDDLPLYLQAIARFFAAIILGAWLQTLAPRAEEKDTPVVQGPVRAAPAKPDSAAKPVARPAEAGH